MKHVFYSDSGHGWLAVPRTELVELGIMHKISSYSYQRNDTVYLEEDCDASVYAASLEAAGKEFKYKSAPQSNSRSKIRNYDSFRPTASELNGVERYPSGWQFA